MKLIEPRLRDNDLFGDNEPSFDIMTDVGMFVIERWADRDMLVQYGKAETTFDGKKLKTQTKMVAMYHDIHRTTSEK